MIEYPMPGQAPDLFKGFREELANIEKVEQQEQQRALKMSPLCLVETTLRRSKWLSG
jgi:hypothetical protein